MLGVNQRVKINMRFSMPAFNLEMDMQPIDPPTGQMKMFSKNDILTIRTKRAEAENDSHHTPIA